MRGDLLMDLSIDLHNGALAAIAETVIALQYNVLLPLMFPEIVLNDRKCLPVAATEAGTTHAYLDNDTVFHYRHVELTKQS